MTEQPLSACQPWGIRMCRIGGALVLGASCVFLLGACAGDTPQPDLDLHRGMNAFAEGRFELARAYYTEDLDRHPERLEAQRGLALSWLSGAGQSLEPAQAILKSYLAGRPDDEEMRRRYARNLITLGDGSKALTVASQLTPSVDRTLLRCEAMATEDPDAAWRELEPHLSALDPRIQLLAASLAQRLGNQTAALAQAQRAVDLAPLGEAGWYLLGRLQLAAGERDKAQLSLEIHQALGTLARGGSQGGALSPIESLRVLDGLAGFPRESQSARLFIARLQLRAGFIDQALAALPDALENAESGDRLEIAELLTQRGMVEAAERLYREELEKAPGSRRARSGLIALLIAQPAARKRLAEASRLLQEGLEIDPNLARYHLQLGRLKRHGEPESATLILTRALELAPWNAACRVELAELHLAAGDRQAAARLLDRAPERSPILESFRHSQGFPQRSTS